MIMNSLPDQILVDILLMLDGPSLHTCRQVCSTWDTFILQEIWGTKAGRKRINLKLRNRWKYGEPNVSLNRFEVIDENSGEDKYSLLDISQDICVVRRESESSEQSLSLVIMEAGQRRWEVCLQTPYYIQTSALVHPPLLLGWDKDTDEGGPDVNELLDERITKALILDYVIVAVGDLGTVMFWNRGNGFGVKGMEVYKEKYLVRWQDLGIKADKNIVVIWNEEFQELTVIELQYTSEITWTKRTIKSCHPNPVYLLDFSSPYLLTQVIMSETYVWCWNIMENHQDSMVNLMSEEVLELGALFYPYAAFTFCSDNVTGWENGWKIEVWDIKNGSRLRQFGQAGYITDMKYCSGRLSLCRKVEDRPMICVYETKELVEKETSDPQCFSFPLEVISDQINLTKTHIYLTSFETTAVTLQCWNFWS